MAKSLSFSGASKKLYISQSAVSQSIKSLEKKLGRQLFIRSTKSVKLTPDGEMLFKHIEPAINLIMRGENQILESNTLNGGQLRIGASDTICRYYLVPYIKAFHEHFPNVHIKVTNGTSAHCVDFLENGQVDFIVTNYPNPRINTIANTIRDMLQYPILMLDQNSMTSEFLHGLFRQRKLELVPEVELSSNDLLIDLARIGLGIAFVPDFCVSDKDPDLFRIRTSEDYPTRSLVVGYNSRVPLSEASKYFIDSLKNDFHG